MTIPGEDRAHDAVYLASVYEKYEAFSESATTKQIGSIFVQTQYKRFKLFKCDNLRSDLHIHASFSDLD